MSLGLDVAGVARLLVAVRCIVGRGNEFHFDGSGGWIRNVARSSQVLLERKGGVGLVR